MAREINSSKSPINLGRPLMKMTKVKIDVYDGTTSMEFGDTIAKFNIVVLSESVDKTYSNLFSNECDTYSCDFSSVFTQIEAAL